MARKDALSPDYLATFIGIAAMIGSTLVLHPLGGMDEAYRDWFAPLYILVLLATGLFMIFKGAAPAWRRGDFGPAMIAVLAIIFVSFLREMATTYPEVYASLLGEAVLASIIAVAAAPRFLPREEEPTPEKGSSSSSPDKESQ